MNAIVNIDFHGHSLATADINGTPHVAMKPIVEAIGLQWRAQRKRIYRHPVLCKGVSMMDTPSNGGIQRMLMLPLRLLNGWLFGVDVNRVKPEIRDTLIQYQRECFDVLADYWLKGKAVNPRVTLTPEQKCHIQELVNERSHNTGIHYATLYRSLKSQFRVGSYKEILASDYPAACRFLGGEPRTESPLDKEDMSLLPVIVQMKMDQRERGGALHRYVIRMGRDTRPLMMPMDNNCAIINAHDETSVSNFVHDSVPASMLPTLIKIGVDRLADQEPRMINHKSYNAKAQGRLARDSG